MGESTGKGSNNIISKTKYTFSGIFIAFSEATQKFPYFENKDQLHSLNILPFIDPEKCGYFLRNVVTPFASKRVRVSQTLLERELKHFYRNFPLI